MMPQTSAWSQIHIAHVALAMEASSLRKSNAIRTHSKPFFGGALRENVNFRGWNASGRSHSRIASKLTPEEYFEREELRWQREEKRWLREEERWLREKKQLEDRVAVIQLQIDQLKNLLTEVARSNPELFIKFQSPNIESVAYGNRDELIQSIQLSQQLPEASESRADQMKAKETSLPEIVAQTSKPAQTAVTLPVQNNGSSTTDSISPIKVNERLSSIPASDIIAAVASRTTDGHKKGLKESENEVTYRTLKSGSEGDEVKDLHDALSKLGFYCGEEDIEFSYYSQGTESAVKTWQATVGAPETGIMNSSLLSKLYQSLNPQTETESKTETEPKPVQVISSSSSTTSAPPAPKPFSEPSEASFSASPVFLLGENRWEDPNRLSSSKKGSTVQVNNRSHDVNLCIACKGARSLICMECDGSGELNIEEQFLDWVSEEAKCLYCDGTGAIPCDVCEGN